MAEYALDTHACLWALVAPKKLGQRARRVLENADERGDTVWLPAATVAEVVMLKELGRTEVGLPSLREAFETTCWRFLPLELDQLDQFATLSALRDPFDRLIIAAARSTRAKLISRDETLQDLGLVDVVWS